MQLFQTFRVIILYRFEIMIRELYKYDVELFKGGKRQRFNNQSIIQFNLPLRPQCPEDGIS